MSGPQRYRGRQWLGLVLTLLVLSGHTAFWYWPRLHLGQPEAESLAVRLVSAESDWAYSLWVPYPHQNLGRLAKRLGGIDPMLSSMRDLLGQPSLDLPAFGPFQIPPSRELAVVTDVDGEEFRIALAVFPVVRWMLRAAGWVAGNAWLRGGEIDWDGRRLQVRWQDGYWLVSSSSEEPLGPALEIPRQAVLGLVRIGLATTAVPPGIYRVGFEGADLVAASSGDPAIQPDARPRTEAAEAAALWARAAKALPGKTVHGVALLPQSAAPADRLPAAVVFHWGEGERWRLPGERILKALGDGPAVGSRDGWLVAAYDRPALQRGLALLPYFEAFRMAAARGRLEGTGELDLTTARPVIRSLGEVLYQLPILGRPEARRWLALADLLEAFREFDRLSLVIQPEGRLEARLRARAAD